MEHIRLSIKKYTKPSRDFFLLVACQNCLFLSTQTMFILEKSKEKSLDFMAFFSSSILQLKK